MKKNSWSYSSLKDFEGCGFRYHQVKVAKKYPFVETEAAAPVIPVTPIPSFEVKNTSPTEGALAPPA